MAGNERTVQYEGPLDEPTGAELDRLRTAYFAAWPDGPSRAAWPGLVYIRARPTWIRYSDFTRDPPVIAEFTGQDLAGEQPRASVSEESVGLRGYQCPRAVPNKDQTSQSRLNQHETNMSAILTND